MLSTKPLARGEVLSKLYEHEGPAPVSHPRPSQLKLPHPSTTMQPVLLSPHLCHTFMPSHKLFILPGIPVLRLCQARACVSYYDPEQPFQPVGSPWELFTGSPRQRVLTVAAHPTVCAYHIVDCCCTWLWSCLLPEQTVSSSRSHTLSEPLVLPHHLHKAWPQKVC